MASVLQTESPKRIFVSYSSPDQDWARWIATRLRDHGHRVTIQADDFLPGMNFVVEMRSALADVDHVVAVLSPAYEESGFAMAEWTDAFSSDPVGSRRRLIGVRVVDYRPGPLIRASIYADLCGANEDEAVRRLLRAVNPHEHAASTTPFPGQILRRSDLSGRPPIPPHCVWRQEDVSQLRSALVAGRNAAITGMGGVGKTSLATRLLQDVADDFDVLVWIHGGEEGVTEQAVVRAAIELEIATNDSSPSEALAALRDNASSSWLVVVDDCPDGSGIVSLLPSAVILATSRNDRGWTPAGFEQLRLQPWTRDEVVEFLSDASPSAVDAGDELAERLGGLPLAVAQAAAYIDASGLTGAAYLERLDNYASEVLGEPLSGTDGPTVLSVWAIALDHLRDENPYAAQMLDVMAFLARDQISVDLIRSVSSMPEPFASSRHSAPETDRALAALLRQSLCTIELGSVAVHPLIQSVVASRLGRDDGAATLGAVVQALADAAPAFHGREDWYEWEQLGPHVLAAFGAAQSFRFILPAVRPLATSLAEALFERGYPHAAVGLRADILGYILKHRDGFAPDDVAAAAHDLGNSYAVVQMSTAAVDTYRIALQVDDLLGQRASTRNLASVVGLVGALTDIGELEEAELLIQEAAERWELSFQEDRELGIMIFGTWGRLLTRTSRPGDARPHLLVALRLAQDAGVLSEVAITRLHLGNADLAENDLSGARTQFELALEIAAALPDAHHLRASIMQNLASVDLGCSRPAEAYARATSALAELGHVPEGEFSVLAGLLHYTRAQVDLANGDDISSIVSEAGSALDVLCAHLPVGHPHREQVAGFLFSIADRLGDARLRQAVETRRSQEPES